MRGGVGFQDRRITTASSRGTVQRWRSDGSLPGEFVQHHAKGKDVGALIHWPPGWRNIARDARGPVRGPPRSGTRAIEGDVEVGQHRRPCVTRTLSGLMSQEMRGWRSKRLGEPGADPAHGLREVIASQRLAIAQACRVEPGLAFGVGVQGAEHRPAGGRRIPFVVELPVGVDGLDHRVEVGAGDVLQA